MYIIKYEIADEKWYSRDCPGLRFFLFHRSWHDYPMVLFFLVNELLNRTSGQAAYSHPHEPLKFENAIPRGFALSDFFPITHKISPWNRCLTYLPQAVRMSLARAPREGRLVEEVRGQNPGDKRHFQGPIGALSQVRHHVKNYISFIFHFIQDEICKLNRVPGYQLTWALVFLGRP